MPLVLIVILSAQLLLTDLISAVLYSASVEPFLITILQQSRNVFAVSLGLYGLKAAYHSGKTFFFATLYIFSIALYFTIIPDRQDFTVVLASTVKLALPPILLSAGYATLNTPNRLARYAVFLGGFAVASALFGAWDIKHTEFWTETLEYGHYLNGVKGILMGFDSYYVLPFNFFGYENVRRAAGLVAAPLAQGSLLAIGTLVGFAVFQRKHFLWAVAILLIGVFGMWQSGTRGAMLVFLIALPIFLLGTGKGGNTFFRNVMLLGILLVGSYQTLSAIVNYSVSFDDGSTIGHFNALMVNLRDLHTVLFVGAGLGTSGAMAADVGYEMAGGGEGALFSIAYQIGVPSAVLFLLFYASTLWRIHKRPPLEPVADDLALAALAFGIGFPVTFISSDHIFSLSGVGVFWIFLGGVLSLSQPAKHSPSQVYFS